MVGRVAVRMQQKEREKRIKWENLMVQEYSDDRRRRILVVSGEKDGEREEDCLLARWK